MHRLEQPSMHVQNVFEPLRLEGFMILTQKLDSVSHAVGMIEEGVVQVEQDSFDVAHRDAMNSANRSRAGISTLSEDA